MVTSYGNPDASTVLIQLADDHDLDGIESEIAELRRLTDTDFHLIALKVRDWNRDLSPWPAPAVFGNEDFGDGAADTLARVLEYCTDSERNYIIGGYSLAGLFALWASYQTDVFSGAAAASPSVWFPKFDDYMREHTIRVGTVYLSLGDREEKTRNPVMATVGARIRAAHELLRSQGVNTILEWSKGGHFKEPDIRTAQAFAWVMRNRPHPRSIP
jgi:hypothetical protein